MTVTGYLCFSAQRRYMRMSISAKSAASTPPAPARIVMTAGRASYSPSSRVWISRSPRFFCRSASSASASLGAVGVAVALGGELHEHLEVVEAALDAR